MNIPVQHIAVEEYLLSRKPFALTGPTVIQIMMFEAEKDEVLQAVIASVAVNVGDLTSLDPKVRK